MASEMERVTDMASAKPVVIFSRSSCCMCHSIRTLFAQLGVSPTVYQLEEISRGREVEQALSTLGCKPPVPAVFISGKLVGGASEIITLHVNGLLIPMIK